MILYQYRADLILDMNTGKVFQTTVKEENFLTQHLSYWGRRWLFIRNEIVKAKLMDGFNPPRKIYQLVLNIDKRRWDSTTAYLTGCKIPKRHWNQVYSTWMMNQL